MHRVAKNFRALGQLGQLLEQVQAPSSDPVVMVEIAPGVFRSSAPPRRPPAGRLLEQLIRVRDLRDRVKADFEALEGRVRASRRGQR
jgi:hypothetical protein